MSPAIFEAIGLAAATLTTLCWLPQALKIIRSRQTADLSLIAQATFTAGILLWLIYGLGTGSVPLIIANGITFLLAATIVGYTLRFG